MWRIFALFIALWLVVSAGHLAHERANAGTWGLLGVGKGTTTSASFTPSCGNSTTYFARADVIAASITAPVNSAIDGFICDSAVVAAWSNLDVIYLLWNQNATAAKINLKGASGGAFTASEIGGPITYGGGTCPASYGFQFNGSSQGLNTNYNPSTAGGAFAQNSNSSGVVVTNNRTTAAAKAAYRYSSGAGGTGYAYIYPYQTGNAVAWNSLASAIFPSPANSTGTAKGVWQVNRTSANAMVLLSYGVSFDGTYAGGGAASGARANANFYIAAGQGGSADFSDDCLAVFYAGAATGQEAGLSAAAVTFVNTLVPGTLP